MAKNITINWEHPDSRRDGGAAGPEDVRETFVEVSADGGATFTPLATVQPTDPQTVTVPDAEVGEWHFTIMPVDTDGQDGATHLEVVTVPDDSPLNAVRNVEVILD